VENPSSRQLDAGLPELLVAVVSLVVGAALALALVYGLRLHGWPYVTRYALAGTVWAIGCGVIVARLRRHPLAGVVTFLLVLLALGMALLLAPYLGLALCGPLGNCPT
jgi:hypothetical protein